LVQHDWAQQVQPGHLQAGPHWQSAPQGHLQAAAAVAAHGQGLSHLQAPAGHWVQHGLAQQVQPGHLQAGPHLQSAPQGHLQAAAAAAAHGQGFSHLQAPAGHLVQHGWAPQVQFTHLQTGTQAQAFETSSDAVGPSIAANRIKDVYIPRSPSEITDNQTAKKRNDQREASAVDQIVQMQNRLCKR
jgi:hypothetical protein